MKYLYTVLDRKKVGNSSVYLVRNLKTKEEKVMPIDWIRKQYPKGVFSNISISETGKINIVKDKTEVDILSKLLKKVKIIEFIDDAKLDGLPYIEKGRYAVKEIEVLKKNFLTPDLFNCVKLTEESQKFLDTSEKGDFYYEREVVEIYANYAADDYVGERCADVPYPDMTNEDTSLLFEVDIQKLKLFCRSKGLNLSVKELKIIEKALIYSCLYYLQEWFAETSINISDIPKYFKNKNSKDIFGDIIEEDAEVLGRSLNDGIEGYYDSFIVLKAVDKYIDLATDYSYGYYMSRVVNKNKQLYYEVYCRGGVFDRGSYYEDLYWEEKMAEDDY